MPVSQPSHEELLAAKRVGEESSRLVRAALEALNAGDIERFVDFFAEDMRFQMNGSHQFSKTCETRAEFIELVGQVAAGLDEMITLELRSFHIAGPWIICETDGTAVTTSGESYCNHYCMLWQVENGKITELREYNDSSLVEKMFPT